ncbi:hypothetical protein DEO72_LG2g3795 [Vigna unguiculata]|uniref:Uncharacterized protein n=1 Tax=Vigna unguiculata TaxID=3917 RepID=A0A4D6L4L2_VIGUN|nr:hypothetical protein DEO72_LG2g3795 [Vigna unguiculata]
MGTETSAPGGEASPIKRDLQRGCFQRRYAPGDMSPARQSGSGSVWRYASPAR